VGFTRVPQLHSVIACAAHGDSANALLESCYAMCTSISPRMRVRERQQRPRWRAAVARLPQPQPHRLIAACAAHGDSANALLKSCYTMCTSISPRMRVRERQQRPRWCAAVARLPQPHRVIACAAHGDSNNALLESYCIVCTSISPSMRPRKHQRRPRGLSLVAAAASNKKFRNMGRNVRSCRRCIVRTGLR
jgi:hypothetical protein